MSGLAVDPLASAHDELATAIDRHVKDHDVSRHLKNEVFDVLNRVGETFRENMEDNLEEQKEMARCMGLAEGEHMPGIVAFTKVYEALSKDKRFEHTEHTPVQQIEAMIASDKALDNRLLQMAQMFGVSARDLMACNTTEEALDLIMFHASKK